MSTPAFHFCTVEQDVFFLLQAVLLDLNDLSSQVVQVVSSLVFSVLEPAVNFSVLPHDVRLAEQDVAVLVPVLNRPLEQARHLVSSELLWLLLPPVKYCA